MSRCQKLLHQAIVLGVFLLGSASLQAQEWNPADEDNAFPAEVPANLKKAVAFLYLDQQCNGIAFVMPGKQDVSRYLPDFDRIDWNDRLRALPDSTACKDNSRTWKRDLKDDGSNLPGVCDPLNDNVSQASRNMAWCGLPANEIKYLVVLDQNLKPVLILKDRSAKAAVPAEVPSRALARKGMPIHPCAPVTPSPCLPPRQATLVPIGGGKTACVCL